MVGEKGEILASSLVVFIKAKGRPKLKRRSVTIRLVTREDERAGEKKTFEMFVGDHRDEETIADPDHFAGDSGGASLNVNDFVVRSVGSRAMRSEEKSELRLELLEFFKVSVPLGTRSKSVVDLVEKVFWTDEGSGRKGRCIEGGGRKRGRFAGHRRITDRRVLALGRNSRARRTARNIGNIGNIGAIGLVRTIGGNT